MRLHAIFFVEDEQLRRRLQFKGFQNALHGGDLLLEIGVADIHDMQQQISVLQFL